MQFVGLLVFLAAASAVAAACGSDNCGRAAKGSPSALSVFCAAYTNGPGPYTLTIPAFLAACSADPSRLSTACSCVSTGSGSTTSTTSSSGLCSASTIVSTVTATQTSIFTSLVSVTSISTSILTSVSVSISTTTAISTSVITSSVTVFVSTTDIETITATATETATTTDIETDSVTTINTEIDSVTTTATIIESVITTTTATQIQSVTTSVTATHTATTTATSTTTTTSTVTTDLCFAPSSAPTGSCQLSNGDFETGQPDPWVYSFGVSGVASYNVTTAISGVTPESGCWMLGYYQTTQDRLSFSQNLPSCVPKTSGTTVTLSVYWATVMSSGQTCQMDVCLAFGASGCNVVIASSSTGWQHVTMSLSGSSANTAAVEVLCTGGAAEVFVDNISISYT